MQKRSRNNLPHNNKRVNKKIHYWSYQNMKKDNIFMKLST